MTNITPLFRQSAGMSRADRNWKWKNCCLSGFLTILISHLPSTIRHQPFPIPYFNSPAKKERGSQTPAQIKRNGTKIIFPEWEKLIFPRTPGGECGKNKKEREKRKCVGQPVTDWRHFRYSEACVQLMTDCTKVNGPQGVLNFNWRQKLSSVIECPFIDFSLAVDGASRYLSMYST